MTLTGDAAEVERLQARLSRAERDADYLRGCMATIAEHDYEGGARLSFAADALRASKKREATILTREEAPERLRHLSNEGVNCEADAVVLREAAELLEAGESRDEYRVIGDVGPTLYYREGDLDRARRLRDYGREHGRPAVRIQQRTITTTPWTDIEDGETDA